MEALLLDEFSIDRNQLPARQLQTNRWMAQAAAAHMGSSRVGLACRRQAVVCSEGVWVLNT